jgi:hypothetical protein
MFSNMRTRAPFVLVLVSMFALVSAMPAQGAKQPVPGIKKTPQFRALERFVTFLGTRAEVPTSEAQKGAYRIKLKTRRTSANLKATALFNRRIDRLSKRDDKKQREQIRQIRSNQKIRVNNLRAALNVRLGRLENEAQAAVARVNDSYDERIGSLTRKRNILQERLDKATEPARRNKISGKIEAVQAQINKLVGERQSEANDEVARYEGRKAEVNELFSARIDNAQDAGRRAVAAAKRAYERLYRKEIAAAKSLKAGEIAIITAQRDLGAGYIDRMPLVPEPLP